MLKYVDPDNNVLYLLHLSENSVKWLATNAFVSQCLLELPFAFLATKVSLRSLVLTGCSLALIGCLLKNAAVLTNLFPLLFIGQVIAQLPWALTISRAGQLANMWCYADEISLATVIGSTGHMLGKGLGFLVPIFIVQPTVSHGNGAMNSTKATFKNDVKMRSQLTLLYSVTTGISAFVLILMIFLYRHDPETPPTVAERKRSIHVSLRASSIFEASDFGSLDDRPPKPPSKMKKFSFDLKIFWEEIQSIFRNKNWRLLLGSFTLINGCIEAFQIEAVFIIRNILSGSPEKVNLQVSVILTALWISKLFSSWIAGFIADRFHNFKKLGLGIDFKNALNNS